MTIKPKVEQRPLEVRLQELGTSERKGRKQSQSKKEAAWATARKVAVVGLPKPLGIHTMLPCGPDTNDRVSRLNIYPGFRLALVQSLLCVFLFCHSEIGKLALCHCVLRVYELIFDFKGLQG